MDGGDATLSPVKRARREKIMDAAQSLFLTRGLRGTTVEGIAETVGMSKVTIYSYFNDKDAIFAAVVARFFNQMREAFYSAISQPGRPAERIARALIVKQGAVYDLVRLSPFAEELLAEGKSVGTHLADLDVDVTLVIADILSDADTARVILHSSLGILEHANSRAEFEDDLRRVVHTMCSGVRRA
ncbi:MAG: TetR/AcrR family transcriptional regulator [Rhodobacteraceae bacterium]|nr:TetR/AcrR family transcriptional regulator [Paracoccaceae bacterium]